MNTFNFFTGEDLKGIGIDEKLLAELNLLQQQNSLTIEDTYQLLGSLYGNFQKYVIEYQTQNPFTKQNVISYNFTGTENKEFQDLILLSNILIIKIREFLTQEQFEVSIGFQVKGTNQYAETTLLFDELLSNEDLRQQHLLLVSINQKCIKFNSELKKLQSQQTNGGNSAIAAYQHQLDDTWEKIIKLGMDYQTGLHSDYVYEIKTAQTRRHFYWKNLADTRVLVSPVGPKPQYYYYYSRRDAHSFKMHTRFIVPKSNLTSFSKSLDLIFFNRGWLYEWYKDILAGDMIHQQELITSVNKNNLEPLFKNRSLDNIKASRGGDTLRKSNGQYITTQQKYQNLKFMSFNQVYDVLRSLFIQFQLFYTNSKKSKVSLAKKLQGLLIDKSVKNLSVVNESMSKVFLDMIKNWKIN